MNMSSPRGGRNRSLSGISRGRCLPIPAPPGNPAPPLAPFLRTRQCLGARRDRIVLQAGLQALPSSPLPGPRILLHLPTQQQRVSRKHHHEASIMTRTGDARASRAATCLSPKLHPPPSLQRQDLDDLQDMILMIVSRQQTHLSLCAPHMCVEHFPPHPHPPTHLHLPVPQHPVSFCLCIFCHSVSVPVPVYLCVPLWRQPKAGCRGPSKLPPKSPPKPPAAPTPRPPSPPTPSPPGFKSALPMSVYICIPVFTNTHKGRQRCGPCG